MRCLVDSSLLLSIAYSRNTQLLDLEFRSGVTYRYVDVPETVVQEFVAAESKGAYFNHRVRNCFPCQKV